MKIQEAHSYPKKAGNKYEELRQQLNDWAEEAKKREADKKITRCYLTALLTSDQKRVKDICINHRDYQLPKRALLARMAISKRPKVVMMACQFIDTTIYASQKRQERMEERKRLLRELDKVKQQKVLKEDRQKWIQRLTNEDKNTAR